MKLNLNLNLNLNLTSLSCTKWQDVSWNVCTGSTRLLFLLMDGLVIFYPISTKNAAG